MTSCSSRGIASGVTLALQCCFMFFCYLPRSGKNLPVALTLEHVSPVTRLLEKRKKMLEVQRALDAQKDEYLRKEVPTCY